MILFIKILFALVIIIVADVFPQDCEAHLTIISDIENVYIFIDDSLAGSGKNITVILSKGQHKIVALENSDRWDAKSFIDSLDITDCNDITLEYNFNKEVLLNTEPQDVYVFSNDSLIGYTPLLIPMDLNNIRLEKNGFENKIINYSDFGINDPVKLNFIGEYDDGNFFDKTLFKILLGTMVALGVTTAYFKLEADDKFAEYKITGDPALLEQTNRLDTISAVTFVALQINFGTIIYLFLVD
ncbi:MAG: hypothetical protein E2O46_00720 [Ignavibacteria bacterium]|nr:MAG: hypothetical protein E2O46_00720 [Ignavibacteria bacterium]